MNWTRLTLGALVLSLACAPKPGAEAPLPKPNVDPGRVSPPEARVPPPGKDAEPAEDTLQPMVPAEAAYSHGWPALESSGSFSNTLRTMAGAC
jgi:hypothetical protein